MDDGSGRFRNNSTDKSSRCRREDNPNKRSRSDHYQRERERHHRKRSRERSYEECSRSYKRPRLDDKPRRSSRLSVGECTLEARRGSSGVRSVAGSQLRRDERERRPASSSFRASKGEGRNQGEVSYKEVTAVVDGPWAARLPSSYYYCSGDKVVRGTEKLRELHSKVRNLMLKFTRTVPPECHFLPSLDVESGPEEVSERETPKGVEPKGEHPKQVELNREQPEEVELKGELLENEEQKEKIRREDPTTVEPKGELSRHDDQNGRVPSLTETEEEPSKLKKSNDEVTIKEKSEKEGHFEELKKDHKSEAREKVTPFNEHLPVNAPGKVRTMFKMENYSTYGKVSGVDFTAAPPDSWHAYEIRINPSTNFKFGKGLSKITVDGTTFYFQGFTILSPHAQEKIPKPTFTRYGGSYRIEMVVNQVHKNYTLGDVLLFEEYFFGKLLEMYDWIECMF